jgi:DivIVA domain-containing protein
MELTPELFEKIEFTERRRGYDTEEVETFLEQAGTALAQMLASVRQTEASAADADSRIAALETQLAEAQHASPAVPLNEEEEVEQAARTLLAARRTSEAIEDEARKKAQELLLDAKSRADRTVSEAQAEAEEMVAVARAQADQDSVDHRARLLDEVRDLEARRVELTAIVGQLDDRLAAYRDELTAAAAELTALATDPSRVGPRPAVAVPVDEVLPGSAGAEHTAAESVDESESESEAIDESEAGTESEPAPVTGAVPTVDPITGAVPPVTGAVPTVDPITGSVPVAEPATGVVSMVPPAAPSSAPATGSVPEVEFESIEDATGVSTGAVPEVTPPAAAWPPVGEGEPTVVDPAALTDEPFTGSNPAVRDRYLDDLEQAVNDPEPQADEAMTAFFEGAAEGKSRRFGWRK